METMTSRERVMKALNHEPTDRIPIDIGGMHNLTTMHRDTYKKLQEYMGIDEPAEISSPLSQSIQPNKFMRERFHTDCYPLYFPLTEEQKNPTPKADGSHTYTDDWGLTWLCPAGGLYFDCITHPLEDAEIEDLEDYPWPGIYEDKVYEELAAKAKHIRETTDYAIVMNGTLDGGTMLPVQYLTGFEEFYARLLTDEEFIKALLEKIVEYQCAQWDKVFEYFGEYIDIVRLSDDLGTQRAPLMSPEVFRAIIKPAQKKIVDHVRALKPDIKFIYHCDGAIRQFLPDFIEIGYDAWNPVQVSADGIDDTAALKREFGDKICFWGAGCDSQAVIAKETPEVIRAEVRRRINDMAAGGGLVLGSIHNLQRDVPAENIVAFYDALYEYSIAYYENGGRV